MTDESRRSGLVAAAAGAQAAWQPLYERLLQVEFDGYAGADADVFCERWTVLNAHRLRPPPTDRRSKFSASCSTKRSRSSIGSSHGGHDELRLVSD
jgi:hypothetical protein